MTTVRGNKPHRKLNRRSAPAHDPTPFKKLFEEWAWLMRFRSRKASVEAPVGAGRRSMSRRRIARGLGLSILSVRREHRDALKTIARNDWRDGPPSQDVTRTEHTPKQKLSFQKVVLIDHLLMPSEIGASSTITGHQRKLKCA
jgi:hypothetical protein